MADGQHRHRALVVDDGSFAATNDSLGPSP